MADKVGLGTFITDQSELTTSGLDIFTVPPVDSVLKEGRSVYYYPTTSVTNAGPYEFHITRDPDAFIHLPLTRLEGCLEVTRADGKPIEATETPSVVNLFPQSIFKQVECQINGTEVCDLSTPTYAYKSFLETHLTYSESAKKTHLQCSLYEKDEVKKEEVTDKTNEGSKNRADKAIGKEFFFSNIIHSDFFQSEKYLIPNTDVHLKFIRNEDAFSILGPKAIKYMVNVKNLKLLVRKVKIEPSIHNAIESQLASNPAIYNITRSNIRTFQVPSGTSSLDIPNVIQGNLPRSVHIGFVSTEAFNGAQDKNPFYFNHNGINNFNIKINGVPVCPTALQPKFATGEYVREYRWFLDNLGIHHENESNGINMEEFKHNTCIWNFDLTPDLCNSFHLHETRTGSIDVAFSFGTSPTKALTMIVYACYNSSIAIDVDRNVKVLS